MENNNIKTDKRFWLGTALILLGLLLFFNSMGILDLSISRIIFSWPFFFLVIGLIITLNTNKKFFGGIISGIGAIFLVPRIFPNVDYDGTVILAIVFIAIGVYIIFNRLEKERDKIYNQKKDIIDDIAIFGGGEKIITSDNFRGGSITAIFGGSEIILKGCKLAEGTNVIDILCVFGGTTLIVPSDWNVVINVTPIFGGFSNKIFKDPSVNVDLNKTVIIKGLVIFGGGEVKTHF
jgi:predicted membrane protein